MDALYTRERERQDNLADLYSILRATEGLEKLYTRDAISQQSYTEACSKLIAQYKTCLTLLSTNTFDLLEFINNYKINCPAAVRRLQIGQPATTEQTTSKAQYVAETVQYFITTMDSLKLNLIAVDQIHPLLSDLMQSLSNISFESPVKDTIKNWLIILNSMKASDELSEDQVRQLLFDLEHAHNAFYRSLIHSKS